MGECQGGGRSRTRVVWSSGAGGVAGREVRREDDAAPRVRAAQVTVCEIISKGRFVYNFNFPIFAEQFVSLLGTTADMYRRFATS